MQRIIFFLNKKAGTSNTGDLRTDIKHRAEEHGFEYKIVELKEKISFSDFEKVLNKYNPTIAVAAGGDGTINLLATLIHGTRIKLGIIPAGSSNGMAYELGIPNDPKIALDAIIKGDAQSIDILKINDQHICVHMGDLGMNAKVIRRYENDDQRGMLGYAKQYFRELGNRRKFHFTLNTGEKQIQSKAVMIVLANSPYYGTGASIAPEGTPDDGWFEAVIVRAFPNWFIFHMAVSMIIPGYSPDKFRKIYRTKEVNITLDEEQEMQIDGEPMGKTKQVNAKILPGDLQVIIPE